MATAGSILYALDIDRATLQSALQAVEQFEASLRLDRSATASIEAVAERFREAGRAASTAGADVDPLASKYTSLSNEIAGLTATQRASGNAGEAVAARLRELRAEAVALAEPLARDSAEFRQFAQASAKAGAGAEQVDRAIEKSRKEADPAAQAYDRLTKEAAGLRDEWVVTGKNGDALAARLREIRDELLRLRPPLEADAIGFAKFARGAAQAETAAAGVEGRIRRLSFAQDVQKGVQAELNNVLARTGPLGQAASSGLGLVGGAGATASIGVLALGGALAGVGIAAGSLIRRGIPEVEATQEAFNILRASGEANLGAVARRLEDLQESGGRAARVFSRSQLAGALAQTVKAGTDANEALTLLATGTKIASAENDDLTESTARVLRNLRQFGLDVSDAAEFGDKLAKAGNLADGSLRDLSEGLATVGPVASKLNLSLDETLGYLVALDNKGLSAAETGATAFRSVLLSLLDPSKDAQATLSDLGVALRDNEGRARPLRDVLRELREALDGDAEAAQRAAQIFTSNGVTAILALDDSVDELTDGIRDSDGALDDYADTMQDGLAPAGRELASSIDDLAASVATLVAGPLEGLQRGLASTIRNVDDLIRRGPDFRAVFDALVQGPVITAPARLAGAVLGGGTDRRPRSTTPAGELPRTGPDFGSLADEPVFGPIQVEVDTSSAEDDLETLEVAFGALYDRARQLQAAVDAATNPDGYREARAALEAWTSASEDHKAALAAVIAVDRATEARSRAAQTAAATAARESEQASRQAQQAFERSLTERLNTAREFIQTLQAQLSLGLIKPSEVESSLRSALAPIETEIAELGPLDSPEKVARFLNLVRIRDDLSNAIQAGIDGALSDRLAGAKLFADKLGLLVSEGLLRPDVARDQLRAALDGVRSEMQNVGPLVDEASVARMFNLSALEDILESALSSVVPQIQPGNNAEIDAALAGFENYRRDAAVLRTAEEALAKAAAERRRELQRGVEIFEAEIRANKRAVREQERRRIVEENVNRALEERERLNARSQRQVFRDKEARLEADALEEQNQTIRSRIAANEELLRAGDYAGRQQLEMLRREKELAREYRNELETRRRQVDINERILQQVETEARNRRQINALEERSTPELNARRTLQTVERTAGPFESFPDAIAKTLDAGVLGADTLDALRERFAEALERGGEEAVERADRQLERLVDRGRSRFEDLRETFRAAVDVGELSEEESLVRIDQVDILHAEELRAAIDGLFTSNPAGKFDELRERARIALQEGAIDADGLAEALGRIEGAEGLSNVERQLAGIQALASSAESALDALLSGKASAGDLIKQLGGVASSIANLIPGGQVIAPIISTATQIIGTVVDTVSRLFDPSGPARRNLEAGIASAVEAGFVAGTVAGLRGESDARQQALDGLRGSLEQAVAQALIKSAGLAEVIATLGPELAAAFLSGDQARIDAAMSRLDTAINERLPSYLAAAGAIGKRFDASFGRSPSARAEDERQQEEADRLTKESADFFGGTTAARPTFEPSSGVVIAAPAFLPEMGRIVEAFGEHVDRFGRTPLTGKLEVSTPGGPSAADIRQSGGN